MIRWIRLAVFVLVLLAARFASALPVVPNAFGFGMDTRAAYACGPSPTVLRVTNLNDSGTGSLRDALENGPAGRVVIFEISGTIVLQSDIIIRNSCLTVAGQTAPSPGITVRGNTNCSESCGGISLYGASNVLFQHIRLRPGDGPPTLPETAAHDAFLAYINYPACPCSSNIVYDHVSVSWTGDKLFSFLPGPPANITVWRSIISEALYYSSNVTVTPGNPSSLGMTIADGGNVSVYQNLFAHNSDRNPEIHEGMQVQFANNVVYDWGKDTTDYQWASLFYTGGPGTWQANIAGNVYIAGTPPSPFTPLYAVGTYGGDTGSAVYLNDNALDSTQQAVSAYINYMSFDPRVGSPPVSWNGYVPMPSALAKANALSNAGARPVDRDSVDTRIVNDVINYAGTVISSQNAVGGWPTLAVNTRTLTLPANPNTVTGSGYTNLELWLQGYAAAVEGTVPPIPPQPPSGCGSDPICQAIALLTSGTTTFQIVGINAGGYINFGTGRNDTGYGIRDASGVIQAKNSGGEWANIGGGSGGGAPATSTYILQTADAALPNGQVLGTLASGLLRNTTTSGVLATYTGTACTNQFLTVLNALGVGTCASVNLANMVTGTLGVTSGGTGLATIAQGDLLYGSASNVLARLTKNTTATRYLANTGGSNNPNWDQVALGTGVSGALPVAHGGTGLTSGISGGIPYFSSTGTMGSSAFLPSNMLLIGGGTGASPKYINNRGTTTTVLHGNAAGAPSWAAVNLTNDTTGTLSVARGGTAIGSYAVGDVIYASGSTTLSKLADVSAGSYLRSGGVTTAPLWSTAKLPNTATTGDLMYASGTNTYANLADVAAGSYLRAGGVASVPVWSTLVLPNAATTGDIIIATSTNTLGSVADVATGRVLVSGGVGVAPAWSLTPTAQTFTATLAFTGPGTAAAIGSVRLANAALVAARNAGDSGDITLVTSTAADHVQLGSANAGALDYVQSTNALHWRAGTPTISSGFGTTPSIAGNSAAFRVTVGSGGDTTGVVLFNTTWSTAPVCSANNETTAQLVRATPTTTQVTLAGTLAASDKLSVVCVGF